MKIFISWSGARSRELAVALRDWLRLVLQYAEPWVSEKDISAGDRWAQTIAGALESSNFGIICITPENLNSQWILFEAGALSKSMLDAKVIPLLLGLELSDLGGPLAQFQAQKADESGLMEVVKAINKVSGNKAADGIIAELVPALWPKLADSIAAIPNKVPTEKHLRPQHEILEDLVTSVRGLSSQMRELDPYDETRERAFERKLRGLHPGMIGELLHAGSEGPDARGVSLLMISGMVRDSMPWPAEVLTESYRELRHAEPDEARAIARRLQRIVRHTLRGPMGDALVGRSKTSHMLAMELPHMIDDAVHLIVAARGEEEVEKGEQTIGLGEWAAFTIAKQRPGITPGPPAFSAVERCFTQRHPYGPAPPAAAVPRCW